MIKVLKVALMPMETMHETRKYQIDMPFRVVEDLNIAMVLRRDMIHGLQLLIDIPRNLCEIRTERPLKGI